MSRIATSSWSLHQALGVAYHPDDQGELVAKRHGPGRLTLLELPARLAERGIGKLELCHFHFPSVDPQYTSQLRAALEAASVELFSILIDAGDIVHPDPEQRRRDLDWIRGWIDVAGGCGAAQVRVIAGCTAPGDGDEEGLVQLSAENLDQLSRYAGNQGVAVMTENFRELAQRPERLLAILDRCAEPIGLCADFGNFKGPDKYDDLAAILPRATSVHAKAEYAGEGRMEREDFVRCLDLSRSAGFRGPYSLIFSSPGDEWEGIAQIQQVVEGYV